MPAFIENNDPSSSAKRGRVVMGSTLGHHQQDDSSEMVDSTRRALATISPRQNEMARQIISAPTSSTGDATDRIADDVSTTCQTEGSTFYLHLNDVDDVDHFQPDSEATSSSTSSTIAPLPKKRCLRRRREQRRYPKERHITAVARDLLAQIDDIEE